MGWFQTHRRPFSRRFLERLDRLEAMIAAVFERLRGDAESPPEPEVIPVRITGTRTSGGVVESSWREITRASADDGGRSSEGYDAGGASDSFAFAARPPASGEAFVVRHWIASTEGNAMLHDVRYTLVAASQTTDAGFWAIINGAENYSATAKWRYSWTEVAPAGGDLWTTVSGGRSGSTTTGYALNTLEQANTGILAYGIEVSAAQCNGTGPYRYVIHDTDGDYEFKPVPPGVVVWMRVHSFPDGTSRAWFSATNPIDGECDNPAAECPPP